MSLKKEYETPKFRPDCYLYIYSATTREYLVWLTWLPSLNDSVQVLAAVVGCNKVGSLALDSLSQPAKLLGKLPAGSITSCTFQITQYDLDLN